MLRRLYRRLHLRREIARLAGPRVLRALAAANRKAFFIQIGANDGRMMDPLRKMILTSRWRGLAVEPVPHIYEQLCTNYASLCDRVQPVNAAVAEVSGRQTFYHLQDVPGREALPDWARGLGSFRDDVILAHGSRIPDIADYLVAIDVPSLNWSDLCARHSVEALDLVLIDTEGYDFEIVRQIDFDQYRPVVLIYEHHHFDAATDTACTELLKQQGYGLFREGLDTWALDMQCGDECYADLLQRWPRWVESSPYAEPL